MFDRILMLNRTLDLVTGSLGKLALVEYVQELFGLHRIKVEAVAAHKLQRVPVRWIVTRGDSDAPLGFEPGDCQLQTRCRANAQIDYLAAGGEQSRHHRGADHWPRGAGVATNKNASAIEVGTERLRESHPNFRRECLTDNSAHTCDANF